jgi:4-hydroxy-tetrahydrodipicolinate synthase
MLDAGVTGLVALGTTGESPVLDATETRQVIAACAAVCADRAAPLMVGTGTNDTRTTIAHTVALEDVPEARFALVVVPYYNRPSEGAIVEHLLAVADHSPVPIVVYNVPYRTGRGLGAAALVELAAHPNIAGMKQGVGALDHDTLAVLAARPATFAVLAGDDAFIAPTVLAGGDGAIAAAAHACTESFVALVQASLDHCVADAKRWRTGCWRWWRRASQSPIPRSGRPRCTPRAGSPPRRFGGRLTPASPAARDRLLAAIAAV